MLRGFLLRSERASALVRVEASQRLETVKKPAGEGHRWISSPVRPWIFPAWDCKIRRPANTVA